MSADTTEFVYDLARDGERYRLTWLGTVDVLASRVRAFAFPEPRRLLLVRGGDGLQIPGGGVEPGESGPEALHRELHEEAAASILAQQRLGAFRIEGLTHPLNEVHDFYACRVSLAEGWVPPHDISERVVVSANEFLDALPWGRSDPKAAFLLERALDMEPSLW